jgi:hypothetical protein
VIRGALGRALLLAVLGVVLAPACSLGEGSGTVSGTLDVPDCWSGPFDLHPDFFAAVPYTSNDALQLRIQNGGDYESFSDGIGILIDDAGVIRGDSASDGTARPSLLGQSLSVTLPPNVVPPGVPVKANASPAMVHATLYLQKTCRTQNVALYAVDAVSLEADGTCDRPDGGPPPLPCGASSSGGGSPDGGAQDASTPDAGATDASTGEASALPAVAGSTIVFNDLFDGDPSESDAQKRLTDARFDFYLADPREICPGGIGPPPRCRGHLTGQFRFYFQRGRPAQPFP